MSCILAVVSKLIIVIIIFVVIIIIVIVFLKLPVWLLIVQDCFNSARSGLFSTWFERGAWVFVHRDWHILHDWISIVWGSCIFILCYRGEALLSNRVHLKWLSFDLLATRLLSIHELILLIGVTSARVVQLYISIHGRIIRLFVRVEADWTLVHITG